MNKTVTTEKFTVRYEWIAKEGEDPYSVNFSCFEITGHDQDSKGGFTVPIYSQKVDRSMEITKNVEEAENYVNGMVKWDGCSHYYFGDSEGYLHLCGTESMESLKEIVDDIFWECAGIMGLNFHGI